MSKSIRGAQGAVLDLLRHFGINSDGARRVKIEAFVHQPVSVEVEYVVVVSNSPLEYQKQVYQVTEIKTNEES